VLTDGMGVVNGLFNKKPPSGSSLDIAIANLDFRSSDIEVRRVLEMMYREPLLPDEHERQSERVRRIMRMNRATFRRLMRYAQEAVQQRGSSLT
jgi:hypothetical protein